MSLSTRAREALQTLPVDVRDEIARMMKGTVDSGRIWSQLHDAYVQVSDSIGFSHLEKVLGELENGLHKYSRAVDDLVLEFERP